MDSDEIRQERLPPLPQQLEAWLFRFCVRSSLNGQMEIICEMRFQTVSLARLSHMDTTLWPNRSVE
ncbi:hypothetical protein NECAME_10071 [Necator americanus]|uniref:Uncharacterized protein n=1 Tax=Necator americanus TaxID=51031 RepID=W2TBU1_NECAM|nr:hypothetical protein NECAME_10071 [Necator americanus]ETN79069.1 hypothetical protein NECAME_10071 [Necator americanus]